MRSEILVIGSINMDLVARTVTLPRPGETVSGIGFETLPGGKGANQAVAAARMGAHVAMLGCVGNDSFGEELRDGLSEAGVDTSMVTTVKDSSGIAQITTSAAGENCITVVPGANAYLQPDDLDRHAERIRSAAVVLLQLEIPRPTVNYAVEILAKSDAVLVLDPAPAGTFFQSTLERVDWLTPNETEVATLLPGASTEEDDLPATAQRLLNLGPRNVVLKLGARGAYLRGRAWPDGYRASAPEVQAVDTTAAGDCFNGVFAYELLRHKSPSDAATFACAAAALSVTKHGAQAAMPTAAQVKRLLKL